LNRTEEVDAESAGDEQIVEFKERTIDVPSRASCALTHVKNPGEFYVHREADDAALQALMSEISAFYR
jgi:predicted amidohydrolase